ncbi:MAG: YkgJ family cysteine cluster protein [Desulforhabdus sp.]|jgi:Fe-S-cluster containining protein|nr:YkgJ family cysteine cluster protein [Desulforhabdus sp.]
MNEEHAVKVLFNLDDKFKFSCHGELACYNTCCRDINIFLTPYDVLRMRKAVGLSSQELLKTYTIALTGEEGLPLLVLKMREDKDKTCPFVGSDGCGIYLDRPWSCRMYPVFPVSSEEREFLIEKKSACLGFGGDKQTTIRDWKRDQGIEIYDKMNEAYKAITHHDYFEKGGKLDPGKTRLVYSACYDLDAFKRFIFETRFFDIYDVERGLIEKIKEDEEELLNFGYRWVRFSLFSEDTLKLKDKQMDKLLQLRSKTSS